METGGKWFENCRSRISGTIIAIFAQRTKFVRLEQRAKMSKISNIMDFLESGIKAEGLRQQAIANNIANLETPGYRRIDVKFKELLAKALDSSGSADLGEIEPKIYQPNTTKVNANGNDVNLEAEVGEMVKNTLRHKAYVRLLNKKYAQIETAINVK